MSQVYYYPYSNTYQVIHTQPGVYYIPQQAYTERSKLDAILTGCLYGTLAALCCCFWCDTMDHIYHDF